MNAYFVPRDQCPCCRAADAETLRRAPYDAAPIRDYLDKFYAAVGGVDHRYLAGAEYVVNRCRACGAVYQAEIPGAELMHQLYDVWMEPQKVLALEERGYDLQHYVYLARQVEMAVRHFGAMPGELTFLDFGMGWGHWCRFAKAYGCRTYGLESSPARVAYARRQGIDVLTEAELAQHRFHFINVEQVFEHVPDPLETLRLLRECLHPGGVIWIGVPEAPDLVARVARWNWDAPKGAADSLNALAPLEHINAYTPAALAAMAARAGLKPVALRVPRRKARPPLATRLRRWLASPTPPLTSQYFTPVD